MSSTSMIPVTVTPEAEAYIAELGMRAEFRQMLEHTLKTVPALQTIKVVLAPPYDLDTPCVIIDAIREGGYGEDDSLERDWSVWKINTFPPEVCMNFVLF